MNNILCNNKWVKDKIAPDYTLSKKTLNIVDLFSGCGGLTLGALEACRHNDINGKIKLAVEHNSAASGIYERNFENNLEVIHKGDIESLITNYPGDPISDAERKLQVQTGNVDILLAGPPCQGHSRLNNHTRSRDPRNRLYLKVARFVELCRPKFVIIENVLNIKKDAGNILNVSSGILEELGYILQDITIKTANYGIAQRRTRHVQIASLNPIDINLERYLSTSVLSDVISDVIDNYKISTELFDTPSITKHSERIDYLFDNNVYDLPNHLRPDCHKNKKHTYPTSYGRLRWDEPSTTITRGFSTMGQGRFVHPLRRRTLTPHEAARIQGFPDFFKFSGQLKRGELHLAIANAVPPRIGAMLVDLFLSQDGEFK